MNELGLAEYFGMAEALGIVATLFVILYFSRKQMQSLSADIQTNVLNDLGDKYLKMVERVMEDQSMQRVFDSETKFSREEAYSFYVLWICSHAYAMRKRNVLDDNEDRLAAMDETYFSKRNHQRNMETYRVRQMV